MSGRKVVNCETEGRKVKRRWLRITQEKKCEGKLSRSEEIQKKKEENM
jgi:hypothetical protein